MAEPWVPASQLLVLGPGSARFSAARPGQTWGPRVKATDASLGEWDPGGESFFPQILYTLQSQQDPISVPHTPFSASPQTLPLLSTSRKLLLDSSYMSRFWLSFFFFLLWGLCTHHPLSTFSMFPLLLVQLIPGCLLNWNWISAGRNVH